MLEKINKIIPSVAAKYHLSTAWTITAIIGDLNKWLATKINKQGFSLSAKHICLKDTILWITVDNASLAQQLRLYLRPMLQYLQTKTPQYHVSDIRIKG